MALTVGSLFAGIGGFDLGFERAGMVTRWQVEIDPVARDVLARRFPDAVRHDDVRTFQGGPVDLICGGFPCQDLSIAGRRKGLSGSRSGLFFEIVRVVREMQEATGGRFPRFLVLENVPGLLSSNGGRDFHTVLSQLAQLGYGLSWRVMDARCFGVAQRRRRVFIVGCLGDGYERAASVLFEPEGGGGDSAAGDEAGARVAATLRGRAHGAGSNAPGRGGEDDENLIAFDTTQVTSALNRSNPKSGDPCHPLAAGTHAPCIANAVAASAGHHGHSSPRGDGSDKLIAFNWKAGNEFQLNADIAPTLKVGTASPAVFAPLNSGGNDGGFRTEPGEHLVVASSGERARALTASMHKRRDEDTDTLIAETITVCANQTTGRQSDLSPGPTGGVRRLTPLECERLQGFPDSWTCRCGEGHKGSAFCTCPDSPRYRMLGNAVTVNVAEWIGRRIARVG